MDLNHFSTLVNHIEAVNSKKIFKVHYILDTFSQTMRIQVYTCPPVPVTLKYIWVWKVDNPNRKADQFVFQEIIGKLTKLLEYSDTIINERNNSEDRFNQVNHDFNLLCRRVEALESKVNRMKR